MIVDGGLLNSYFREVLEDYSDEKQQSVKYILKYINDLYSVYSNLIVFDKTGKVISVSNEKYDFLVGKVLAQDWIEKESKFKRYFKILCI